MTHRCRRGVGLRVAALGLLSVMTAWMVSAAEPPAASGETTAEQQPIGAEVLMALVTAAPGEDADEKVREAFSLALSQALVDAFNQGTPACQQTALEALVTHGGHVTAEADALSVVLSLDAWLTTHPSEEERQQAIAAGEEVRDPVAWWSQDTIMAVGHMSATAFSYDAVMRAVRRWLDGPLAANLGTGERGCWDLATVFHMVDHHHPARSEAVSRLKSLVVDNVLGDLGDPQGARVVQVAKLVQLLEADLTREERQRWFDQMHAGLLADDPDGSRLVGQDLVAVAETLDLLDQMRAKTVLRQVCTDETLARLSPAQGLQLARIAMRRETFSALGISDLPLSKEQMQRENERWVAASAEMGLAQSVAAAEMWRQVGQPDETRQWVGRAISRLEAMATAAESAAASAKGSADANADAGANAKAERLTLAEVAGLGRLIASSGQKAPAQGAAIIVTLTREQGLTGSSRDWRDCAWLVADPGALAMVKNAVVDAQGRPHAGLAVLIAYAARMLNALPDWYQQIATGLAAAAEVEDGDGQAAWLLARAVASEAEAVDPADLRRRLDPTCDQASPETIRRYRDLQAALAVAQSDAMRAQVALQLADYCRSRHRPGSGAELLANLQVQLTDPAASVQLASLADRLRREEDRRLLAEEQVRAADRDMVQQVQDPE